MGPQGADDTATLVFMLLAPSQPVGNGSMTQVPTGSWLISQQLAPCILMHQSILKGPPEPLVVMRV